MSAQMRTEAAVETLWRGFAVQFPDADSFRAFQRTNRVAQAEALLGMVESRRYDPNTKGVYPPSGVGMHWSTDQWVAESWADTRIGFTPYLAAVVLGIAHPGQQYAESDAQVLVEHGVAQYANDEQEVPLRPGTPLRVVEVRWHTDAQEDWEVQRVSVSKTAAEDYMMGHRPTEDGPPAYDLLAPDPEQGEPIMPADIYTHPEHYTGFRQMLPETMRTLRAARGNPSATVTIYRAQRKGTGLNTGDWVSLSKAYAKEDLDSYDEKNEGGRELNTYRVPAHTVRYAGDDLMEWGYFGPPLPHPRTASKTAAEDHSTDVMICLRPPEEAIKAFTGLDECTESAEDLHLTLYYLGEMEDCGGAMGRERIYRGLYDFAIHSGYQGLTGTANGYGCFMNGDSNSLVALWDIPGIAEFRTYLMAYIKSHGLTPRQDDHGFTPHMSLAHADEPFYRLPKLPRNNPEEVEFDSVWLVWGDEWTEVTLA